MSISIIAAMAENRVIGLDGKLPWHIPEDLKYFKKMTLDKKIIMGRKTYESIGRPLPKRTNIVVSTSMTPTEGIVVCKTLQEAYKTVEKEEEAFVIGGASIYQETLEKATKIYLTLVPGYYKGDVYFPVFDEEKWKITNMIKTENCTFLTYERE